MYFVKLSQYGPAFIVLCLLCQPAQALDYIFDNDESELTEEMSVPTETRTEPDLFEIEAPKDPPANQNDPPLTHTPTVQSKKSKSKPSKSRQRAQWIKNKRTTLYWDGKQWQTSKP